MTEESYRQALREAIREYERLSAQRAEIDERIAQLVRTISSLSRLCRLTPTVALGLTDACRIVLKATGHPLSASEVRAQLEAMGFDTSRYSNPLASIHIVLRRLCRSGEVKFTARAYEKPEYAWNAPEKIVAMNRPLDLAKLVSWLEPVVRQRSKE